ncbi:unnamed protein product [Enterobius vermicularis]|uniref:Uncharacterized protein n=1 Tax=Enterobius vermicularis TaxID=51028 RepID=A0A0N4V776_ENTVE|nr:unnamed protein product [Enterobius vermicularis]
MAVGFINFLCFCLRRRPVEKKHEEVVIEIKSTENDAQDIETIRESVDEIKVEASDSNMTDVTLNSSPRGTVKELPSKSGRKLTSTNFFSFFTCK